MVLVIIFHFQLYIFSWTCPDDFDVWKEPVSFCMLWKGLQPLWRMMRQTEERELKDWLHSRVWGLRLRRTGIVLTGNLRTPQFRTHPGRKSHRQGGLKGTLLGYWGKSVQPILLQTTRCLSRHWGHRANNVWPRAPKSKSVNVEELDHYFLKIDL